MPRRDTRPGHGLVNNLLMSPSLAQSAKEIANRPEGNGLAQAHLPRDDGPRHVLGLLPCPRGYVVPEKPPETHWIPRRSADFPTGHRGPHAGHESHQESTPMSMLLASHWWLTTAHRILLPGLQIRYLYRSPPYHTSSLPPWPSQL